MSDTSPTERPIVREFPPVHLLAVDEVRESAGNPRKIPPRAVELVAESIRRFGWKQPLVVDRERNLIVGHTRHKAARSLGLLRVPVVIAEDLTPAEVAAYRIADNRTHDFTTWDLPELSRQLEELSEEFGDVLALADWAVVDAELQQLTDEAKKLDLPAEVENMLAGPGGGFALNVKFVSKEDALAAEQAILDLPGVLDVRHDR